MKNAILRLRKIEKCDLTNVHILHSLPQTDEFNTSGIPENLAETKLIFDQWMIAVNHGEKYIFCLETNDIEFIGVVGMNIGKPKYRKAEIWYKIHPSFWGRGFATDAVKKLLKMGFEGMNLHRIEAGC